MGRNTMANIIVLLGSHDILRPRQRIRQQVVGPSEHMVHLLDSRE